MLRTNYNIVQTSLPSHVASTWISPSISSTEDSRSSIFTCPLLQALMYNNHNNQYHHITIHVSIMLRHTLSLRASSCALGVLGTVATLTTTEGWGVPVAVELPRFVMQVVKVWQVVLLGGNILTLQQTMTEIVPQSVNIELVNKHIIM